jgi:hypothetical protein
MITISPRGHSWLVFPHEAKPNAVHPDCHFLRPEQQLVSLLPKTIKSTHG